MHSDFSQLEKFIENFEVSNNEMIELIKDFLNENAKRILRDTKKRTPVDEGPLRKSWELGEITVNGDNIEVELTNDMDYASFVEFGATNRNGTWRNGRFMMTVSIQEIEEQMPLRFQAKFKKFMKSKGMV